MNKTERMEQLFSDAEEMIAKKIKQIESLVDSNQWKVIEAFREHKVSDYHFAESTGYGYNDRGREVLDEVYARVFGAEQAIVRPHWVSGTHTIATALFGLLRPGDQLLFLTGSPYDTLHKVIGRQEDGLGSLSDWGIVVKQSALNEQGLVDWSNAEQLLAAKPKVVAIQRSRGYTMRPACTIKDVENMVQRIKEIHPQAIVFVDNCYGEFTEQKEPPQVGADLIAGSLIKNPGGGIVSAGGYIAGKESYVKMASYRLTAPGIGGEVGAMLGQTRSMFQGLFLAPHFVGEALKGAVLAAAVFDKLSLNTDPKWHAERSDLIQAIEFATEEQVIAFVQSIQKASPVDAFVVPEPWDMPGYEHPVIMAAGTFMQGGSLELSADAPIRKPYTAYMQGGLTYSHVKLALRLACLEPFLSTLLTSLDKKLDL